MRIQRLSDGRLWLRWDNHHEAQVWWALTGYWVPPLEHPITPRMSEVLNHALNRGAE